MAEVDATNEGVTSFVESNVATGTSLSTIFESLSHFSSPQGIYASDFQTMIRRDQWLRDFKVGAGVANLTPTENSTTLQHAVNSNIPMIFDNVTLYATQFDINPGSDLSTNNYFTKDFDYPTGLWSDSYCPIPVANCWYNPDQGISNNAVKLYWCPRSISPTTITYTIFSLGITNMTANDLIRVSLMAIGVAA